MMKRLIAALLTLVLLLSVCSCATAEYTKVLKLDMTMEDGDAENIAYMQERLTSYGFYTGSIDGKFGKGTYNAVVAFQKKNKLKADGKIGQNTWNALEADDSLGKDDVVEKFASLRKGATGERVVEMQLKLREKKYYAGRIEGKFDDATYAALKSFQESEGMTVDGIFGEKTYEALINEGAKIFQDGAIPRRTLKSGMRGWDVYILQEKLSTLNYLTITPSGFYGASTVAAVKKFQQANGMDATGSVTSHTRRYLWPSAMDQKDQASEQDLGTEYDPYVRPTLRQGSYGKYVSNAQMHLKAGGYLLDKVDGVFGIKTKQAVMAFQKDNGLEADGVIGTDTWLLLASIDVGNAEQQVVDPSQPSVGGASVKLQYGDKGAAVTKLQQQLITLGYLDEGQDDGKFGRKTRTAVRAFQKASKITVDGIVGTRTYVKLNEALGI